MKRPCCPGLLGFGLLLVACSLALSQGRRARKLCGRHLLSEIVKLCGHTNWSQFHFEEGTSLTASTSKESQKASKQDHFHSPHASFPVEGRFAKPASASASWKDTESSWEVQPQPEYQYEKANLLPEKTRELSSLHDVNPYVESVNIQKKDTNKIKTSSSLFWEYHLQRKRRGYSDKCCLKGCTKEELAIACIPYFNF
uniref:insulin-like peptide INSL6 n=1 Tax=Jaculus jaculus TaxID=51337 RepID=UPI001E1B3BDD|nr:insulin-like peptide INSL6 [Jaculus jaculus]